MTDSLYDWLLFLHIVAAMFWVGGTLVLAALALFLVTSIAGRVWCGYTCPQTVWTDLMIAVEDAWAQTEVRPQAAGVQAEIGWCLDPAYQGRGLATEGVAALLEICFDGLGLRRVLANCFADNTASWRLMERLGMRREMYTVRDSLHRSGVWMDGMAYALLADEWRSRRT